MENNAKIISTIYLPAKDEGKNKNEACEYAIKISIQDKSNITRTQKSINGSIVFDEVKNLTLNTFSNDIFELPELFIYLVDKKRRKIYVSANKSE